MVIHGRAVSLAAAAVALALAGTTCKVLNEEHCANQDLPGNEFCLELNRATPYCSPCRREYFGCVDYEPFACKHYDREIGNEGGGESGDGSTGPTGTGSDGESGGTG
ncbi:hypothetical protein [Paraliomyxa miuraensis]|uniref:hypothetical protein n=1 Tax=Paraliomyxa miuraensis TaxID=376150 RepID=UPI002254A282|nr:hypothetical protein [Paraliomyxa miuraensis]MCX4243267.1 hypothetical protein [Paraliomyxa miuraensis]